MPGICALITADDQLRSRFPHAVRCIVHHDALRVHGVELPHGLASLVHLGTSHACSLFDPAAGCGVLLDGYLREIPAGADAARHCLDLYLEHGRRFPARLNGAFNLIAWNLRTGEILIANDRYGLRPLQWAERDGALMFAPEAKALLAAGIIAKELNVRQVANQLSFGRVWIGDETFFRGVRVLPPASVWSWEPGGKIARETYWRWEPVAGGESMDELADACAQTLRQSCAEQMREAGGRVGVSLSGGLDSRVVIAAGGASSAFTWGYRSGNDEIELARMTAEAFRVPWHFVQLTPSDFLDEQSAGIRFSEGLDLQLQGYGLKVYPALAGQNLRALTTGLALDLTMGGSYLPASPSGFDPWEHVVSKMTTCNSEQRRELIFESDLEREVEQLAERARDDLRDATGATAEDRVDAFFMRHRVWRCTFQRQGWQRLFLDDFVPTFDNRLIDLLLGVPPRERAAHRFYVKVLSRFAPAAMNIPYQRTLVPPRVPTSMWEEAARIEREREELYRRIFHATGAAVHLPYNRYYSNFDEWLRLDPDWIARTDALLASAKSKVVERFVRAETLRLWIAEHRSGKRNHQTRLIQLMTLEAFLREYFP